MTEERPDIPEERPAATPWTDKTMLGHYAICALGIAILWVFGFSNKYAGPMAVGLMAVSVASIGAEVYFRLAGTKLTDEPRTIWRRNSRSMLIWLAVMVGLTVIMLLPMTSGKLRLYALIALVPCFVFFFVRSTIAERMVTGRYSREFNDELWQHNTQKAITFAFCALMVLSGLLTIPLQMGLFELPAWAVAASFFVVGTIGFLIAQVWFEWRSGD